MKPQLRRHPFTGVGQDSCAGAILAPYIRKALRNLHVDAVSALLSLCQKEAFEHKARLPDRRRD
jgi:hypothetical protein